MCQKMRVDQQGLGFCLRMVIYSLAQPHPSSEASISGLCAFPELQCSRQSNDSFIEISTKGQALELGASQTLGTKAGKKERGKEGREGKVHTATQFVTYR